MGGSAKFNGSSSTELLCKIEHLCFDFCDFAKPQTVNFHFYITEVLYLSIIEITAKTYVKPVSGSVSWAKESL